jgi:hypothetical protein
MNKQPKRTLIEGWVFLTLLAGVLVVYLNWTYARAESNQAHIIISNYEVGTNYAGLITQQYVQVGDTVRAGEPLFELKSDELTQQLGSGQVTANRLIYPLTTDGQLKIIASKAGIVTRIDAVQGSFVDADNEIALVADSSTLGVTADFTLNRTEVSQLTTSTPLIITLPSHQRVLARISTIVETSQNGRLVTTVQAAFAPGVESAASVAGSRVDATLTLNQSTYYGQLLGFSQNLLSRWFR